MWTTSSDFTLLIFDIVELNRDKNEILNWKLKFPRTMKISGIGTYTRPFKLDTKDPFMHKVIDFFKSVIKEDDGYLEEFGIPEYLHYRAKDKKSHFLIYFICYLNASLKSISNFTIQTHFNDRMRLICLFLHKANSLLFKPNGFRLKLDLVLEKRSSNKMKKNRISIPLYECNDSTGKSTQGEEESDE